MLWFTSMDADAALAVSGDGAYLAVAFSLRQPKSSESFFQQSPVKPRTLNARSSSTIILASAVDLSPLHHTDVRLQRVMPYSSSCAHGCRNQLIISRCLIIAVVC